MSAPIPSHSMVPLATLVCAIDPEEIALALSTALKQMPLCDFEHNPADVLFKMYIIKQLRAAFIEMARDQQAQDTFYEVRKEMADRFPEVKAIIDADPLLNLKD